MHAAAVVDVGRVRGSHSLADKPRHPPRIAHWQRQEHGSVDARGEEAVTEALPSSDAETLAGGPHGAV
ncbi:hypothetical protein ColTof4_08489 [Colletotrichum tofieldiae]|nr:hypothetical protein ColTof3_01988 [Colletotrichum tofieldiae]GKT76066.1 hypothetical protein ColTof4_08489 [Colletotrichum tofieldiae]GKT83791.1 hypothetical protein Ct61P_01641 [Colletotrichum tofieldiae]